MAGWTGLHKVASQRSVRCIMNQAHAQCMLALAVGSREVVRWWSHEVGQGESLGIYRVQPL